MQKKTLNRDLLEKVEGNDAPSPKDQVIFLLSRISLQL